MSRFLIKTILGHCNCFLSSVVTDGKGERLMFSISNTMPTKITVILLYLVLPDEISLISSSQLYLQEHLVNMYSLFSNSP